MVTKNPGNLGAPPGYGKIDGLPEGVVQVVPGFYSTEGTRILDERMSPNACALHLSWHNFEDHQTCYLILGVCKESGKFVAFEPVALREKLREIYTEGMVTRERNAAIEEATSGIKGAVASVLRFLKISQTSDPRKGIQQEPDLMSFAIMELSSEGGSPLQNALLKLISAGYLNLVRLSDDPDSKDFALEPTGKLFLPRRS